MKKRLLASLMSLCLIVGLFPTAAFAAEADTTEEVPQAVVCEVTPGCTLEAGHEGDCVVAPAEGNSAELGNDPAAQPGGEDGSEPADPVCAELAGCVDGAHDPECPLYVVPVEPVAENEIDDMAALADDGMSGNCGNPTYVDGDTTPTDKVKWELTPNNDDSGETTYTLTFTGTGDITWEWRTEDTKRPPYYSYATQITKVVIGEGITGGARAACAGFTALTAVSLPSTFSQMGNDMFSGCTSLTSIDLPASLTSIGNSAFNNCTSLSSVNFAEGTGEIKISGFYNCTSLKNIILPDKVTSINPNTFAKSGLENITIDPSVSCVIGQGAFAECASLTSVTVGENVTSIGKQAFYKDTALTTVSISAKEIGEQAFGQCSDLANVTLNEGVTTIGNNAFATTKDEDKGDLKVLRLPSTITSIGTGLNQAYMLETLDMSAATNITFPSDGLTLGMDGIVYVSTSEIATALRNADSRDAVAIAVTDGGTFAENQNFTSNTFAAPIQNGKIFAGWYDNANFSGTSATSPEADNEGSQTHYPIYYAKWIDMSSLDAESIQYGDTSNTPTLDGVTFSNWQSEDSSIVSVENNQLKANKVGQTTLTADATTEEGGSAKATFSIEVTPRVLSFTYTDTGSGSISYDYSGDAPALSQFMSFAWLAEPKTSVTLDEGTQVNYTYTLDTASGGSGEPETYDELPTNVGQYSVTLNLIDPNYTFNLTGGDSGTSNTLSITVNVEAGEKTRAYLASAAPKGEVFTYNGAGIMPVEGVLQAYAEDSTTSATVEIGQFTVSIRGMNDTVFEESSVTVDAGTDLNSLTGLTLPVKPGQYQITASASNDSYYLYKTLVFAIDKATVTIKPNDITAYVGDAVPPLDGNNYTVTGLVRNDTLTTAPTLSYEGTPDMSTTGTYTIKASGAAANDELYKLAYEDGTLTVSRRSSGGGGGSSSGSTGNVTGSGDDVNIDVSGGSVTTAQMEKAVDKADRGETITIEASSRSSVSLPSSGLQDAADNNNDVTVELKNGEVTLSPEALSAVAEQAGTTVTLTVDPVDTDELNSRQQAAVGDAPVFDLTIKSGGKTIADFDGGLVTVAIPYELPDDQDPAGVVVWFMDDNGNITACETMYDLRTETVIFTTRHFSKYVIGYVEPMDFTDVAEGAYYYDAVAWAVQNGITNGTSATTFGPDVSCTRAQMVTFLWRAAGSPEPTTANNPFTDVQAGSYYYDAVLWAVEQGITSGTSATTFAPDATVTRAQTVTFLWRQAGAPVVNYAMSFTDVDANAYYGEAVRWAVSEGVTSGTSATTFSPDMDCTRAQIVTFLYRDAQ